MFFGQKGYFVVDFYNTQMLGCAILRSDFLPKFVFDIWTNGPLAFAYLSNWWHLNLNPHFQLIVDDNKHKQFFGSLYSRVATSCLHMRLPHCGVFLKSLGLETDIG